jgi:outer membrane immunogenic protein
MKLSSGILGFALTSVVALTSANAADMYVPGPAAPGGYKDAPYVATWAGFYAGVNGGYGWNANDVLSVPVEPVPANEFHGLHPQGGFGGGQVGYNWQGVWHLQLVLGVEADIQGAGIEDKAMGLGADHVPFKSSLDWFGTVRGRLGYALGPSMLYATGGFAYGGLHNETDLGSSHFTSSGTATGYVVGGGVEYKFNPSWSVKAEYQYINLGRNDPALNGVTLCTPAVFGQKCEDDAFHTVRAGINYHFGSIYEPLK